MTAWNLNGAIAAATPSGKPHDFKIAKRSQPEAVYLSAVSLESAKRVCGARDVVIHNGAVVFDPTANKINAAIAECDRYIAKESARAADLRPAAVAELLAKYIAHRAKLAAMLEA